MFTLRALSTPTFPGILAASTERQFTQEAITSTGGLMTDVNLREKTDYNTRVISRLFLAEQTAQKV